MKNAKSLTASAMLFVFLTSCADPYAIEIPTDLEGPEEIKAFQSRIDGLPKQDQQDVAAYILRMQMGKKFGKQLGLEETDGIPAGTTVRAAIEAQRKFKEKERKKKEAQAAEREKAKAKRVVPPGGSDGGPEQAP